MIFNNNRNKGFSFRAPLIYFLIDCQPINSHASLRGRGRCWLYVYVTRCGRDYAGRLTAAHNQARRLTAGPVSEPGDKRLVEVGAPPPLNTQSRGCRRIRTSFGGSSGPPPARVRAGFRPFPGQRVGGGGGPGRISTFSGPEGGWWRGSGRDKGSEQAEGQAETWAAKTRAVHAVVSGHGPLLGDVGGSGMA